MIAILQAAPVHHHWITEGLVTGAVAQWIFSAFVCSMPAYNGPNYFAKWAYAFLHAVAANLDKVHIPGSPADHAAMPQAPEAKE